MSNQDKAPCRLLLDTTLLPHSKALWRAWITNANENSPPPCLFSLPPCLFSPTLPLLSTAPLSSLFYGAQPRCEGGPGRDRLYNTHATSQLWEILTNAGDLQFRICGGWAIKLSINSIRYSPEYSSIGGKTYIQIHSTLNGSPEHRFKMGDFEFLNRSACFPFICLFVVCIHPPTGSKQADSDYSVQMYMLSICIMSFYVEKCVRRSWPLRYSLQRLFCVQTVASTLRSRLAYFQGVCFRLSIKKNIERYRLNEK